MTTINLGAGGVFTAAGGAGTAVLAAAARGTKWAAINATPAKNLIPVFIFDAPAK